MLIPPSLSLLLACKKPRRKIKFSTGYTASGRDYNIYQTLILIKH